MTDSTTAFNLSLELPEILTLDPEWTCWAKCPYPECKSVIHACCRTHLREEYSHHRGENHS